VLHHKGGLTIILRDYDGIVVINILGEINGVDGGESEIGQWLPGAPAIYILSSNFHHTARQISDPSDGANRRASKNPIDISEIYLNH